LNSKTKENKRHEIILAQHVYPHLAPDSTVRPSRCCPRRRRLTCGMAHEHIGRRHPSTPPWQTRRSTHAQEDSGEQGQEGEADSLESQFGEEARGTRRSGRGGGEWGRWRTCRPLSCEGPAHEDGMSAVERNRFLEISPAPKAHTSWHTAREQSANALAANSTPARLQAARAGS
jgi:hypothetical protein